MERDRHVTVIAILMIARGGLLLFLGLIGFIVLTGIGVISGDSTALGVLGLIGLVAIFVMTFVGLPSIIAGIGLLRRKEWGRILALIVGFISLIDIPFGTALGIYCILMLMDEEGKRLFSAGGGTPATAPALSPPA
jgi:hypothetical protein